MVSGRSTSYMALQHIGGAGVPLQRLHRRSDARSYNPTSAPANMAMNMVRHPEQYRGLGLLDHLKGGHRVTPAADNLRIAAVNRPPQR